MSIIKDTFGKDNGLTENELKNIIGKHQETSLVECKRATSLDYNYAIKTVIGFLNKPENNSAGLLMIGIDAPNGIIKDIEPIKNNNFKQNTLRNKLDANIAFIPSSQRGYNLEVIEVPVTGGYVTLVEVQKADPNAVFYSKSENTAYIRHSDTTIKWDLGDMFKTALTKNYPIVYPILTLQSVISLGNNINKYSINTILRNSGTSPGKDVIILLNFRAPTGNNKLSLSDVKGYSNSVANPPYIEKLEADILQINNKPIYPNLDLILGSFSVVLVNDSSVTIDSFTYESHGITTKTFVLSGALISESNYEFIPYFH